MTVDRTHEGAKGRNRIWKNTRSTQIEVESCLTIAPPKGTLHDIYRTWYWQNHDWVVAYHLGASAALLNLSFHVEDPPIAYIRQQIKLTATTTNYGGCRWWLICPNNQCGRKVSR